MYQPRRIARPITRKLGQFAVMAGAASLVAALALLVLTGPSGAVAVAATSSPAAPAGCHPLSDKGTCYEPGEFCRTADHGMSGVAGDGKAITCEDNDGWRWEPQAGSTTPTGTATTAASTGTATSPAPDAATSAPAESPTPVATTSAPVESPFPAVTTMAPAESLTPAASSSAPAGAPATGGGTGPGVSGALAAAGFAIMAVGAGLVFLSRRRIRRVPA